MRTLAKWYYHILSFMSVIGMIGYIGAVVIQVFSRTFLPVVPSWTEEAARYLFIYSVAFGAGIVVLKDEYARVDIFTAKLSGTKKKFYELSVCVIMIAFDYYLAAYSIPKFVFLRFRMVSTAMQIPMQFINFSVLLFAVLQMVSYVMSMIFILTGHDSKEIISGGVSE